MASTTDHFLMLPVQDGEDVKTMRAEPAGVIANSGIMSLKNSLARVFKPLAAALGSLDSKEG